MNNYLNRYMKNQFEQNMNNQFEWKNEQLFWTETWTNILNRNMKFQFKLI